MRWIGIDSADYEGSVLYFIEADDFDAAKAEFSRMYAAPHRAYCEPWDGWDFPSPGSIYTGCTTYTLIPIDRAYEIGRMYDNDEISWQ